jgi:uncharacterized protein YeaO (DUF488 family)
MGERMPGEIRTRRWNDPAEPGDGTRILVCRYRPRALRKELETWHVWLKDLGPSKELHAELYGKHGTPPPWAEFERRYLAEMADQSERIAELARRVGGGETVTLLCSSSCPDEARCHRSLLKRLIGQAALTPPSAPPKPKRS